MPILNNSKNIPAEHRPNFKDYNKLPEIQKLQAQIRGMKNFAIEWYQRRANLPKYQDQINLENLPKIINLINSAKYVEPQKFYSNPKVYKEPVSNILQATLIAMKQNRGAAYPKGLQYTYNSPSFPFSRRFSDVAWHEGIGHMVGDNNPLILKANPKIRNKIDSNSFIPLEQLTYSLQANERHADIWGFRGANVNMKDSKGNYYIDPYRQLNSTDILEMRAKGAKIPEGFKTLNEDDIARIHNAFADNSSKKLVTKLGELYKS